MTELPYFHLSPGMLLVASPEIEEKPFFRSVILLCEHHEKGSFGLLLNKLLEVNIPRDVLDIEKAPNKNVRFRLGGPGQPQEMSILHTAESQSDLSLKMCEDVYLGGDLPFIQEAIRDENGPYLTLCLGHCDWGPGKLESEFLKGNWFLFPATKERIFNMESETLWKTLLCAMGGKYASLSTIPEDLSLN